MTRPRPPVARNPGQAGRVAAAAALLAALLAACSGSPEASTPTTASPTGPATTGSVERVGYAEPVRVAQIEVPGLTESSGLVASRLNPGVLWTHNDSGGAAELFCLRTDGSSCGRLTVTGAETVDWEDLAVGPGGGSSEPRFLHIGDIGDNTASRDSVVVYRVAEPLVPADAGPDTVMVSEPAQALRLTYPDGPVDAETLIVHPTTAAVTIVTKESDFARVFTAAAPDATAATTLAPVTTLEIGFANVRSRFVTAGDISPDGRRVVICTYAEGYEFTLPDGADDADLVWSQEPTVVRLAARDQGEAIAYRIDGAGIFTTSEGATFPLHLVVRT